MCAHILRLGVERKNQNRKLHQTCLYTKNFIYYQHFPFEKHYSLFTRCDLGIFGDFWNGV